VQIRKCSPFLESSLLFGNNNNNDALASNEWKTVPDIWKSSAEKYGDKVALVDPYHDPPSTITYKQVCFFAHYKIYHVDIFIIYIDCSYVLFLVLINFSWSKQFWTLLKA
jgi:hypothetical protein